MRVSFFVLLITTVAPCQVRQQDQIARLLADMTLGAVSRTVGNATSQHALDPERLRPAIVDRNLAWKAEAGSFSVRIGKWTQAFELR